MAKVDRTGWPAGEWDLEPDRCEWRVGEFWACTNRNPHMGFWCGYVGVPEGYRWWGKDYTDIDATVHGGLTYSAKGGRDFDPATHYVVGFDCGHAGDVTPSTYARFAPMADEFYRNWAYTRAEVWGLLRQARDNVVVWAESPALVDEVPCLWVGNRRYTVTGEAGELIRRYVHFDHSDLWMIADYLDDHPEQVLEIEPTVLTTETKQMRRLAGIA